MQRLGVSTKCFPNDSEGASVPRRDRDERMGAPEANCRAELALRDSKSDIRRFSGCGGREKENSPGSKNRLKNYGRGGGTGGK